MELFRVRNYLYFCLYVSSFSLSLSHFVSLSFHISSVSPSLCLCVPSSTSHFVSPSPFLFAPVYSSPTSCVPVSSSPSVYFSSVSPSVCLSSVSPSACFSNCLFVYLSFSPFIHLSLRLSIFLSVFSLSISLTFLFLQFFNSSSPCPFLSYTFISNIVPFIAGIVSITQKLTLQPHLSTYTTFTATDIKTKVGPFHRHYT